MIYTEISFSNAPWMRSKISYCHWLHLFFCFVFCLLEMCGKNESPFPAWNKKVIAAFYLTILRKSIVIILCQSCEFIFCNSHFLSQNCEFKSNVFILNHLVFIIHNSKNINRLPLKRHIFYIWSADRGSNTLQSNSILHLIWLPSIPAIAVIPYHINTTE